MHSRRTVLTTAAAAAAACAAGAAPAHAAAPAIGPQSSPAAAPAPSAATRARLRRLISRMSPEEKAGQLFVMRVYGHSATDPDPADVDANRKEIGVANAAELIAKYHVGGIIYFGWAHNTRDPHQIADLSNGIQRAARRPARPRPAADLHGPGTRHSGPGRRARDALPRGDGARRGRLP